MNTATRSRMPGPSGVNNILIINKAVTPGRVTAIIVNERLGF
jgi:hypothetical protein